MNIPVTLEQTIARMKREIVEDVVAGHVPLNCGSFGDLQDHRDANVYGGFGDDDVADPLIHYFGGRDKEHDGMPDGMMAYMSQAQDAIDGWLREGGLVKSCPPPGWQCVDWYADDPLNRSGNKPYSSAYTRKIGCNGYPRCDLAVLVEDDIYRPAHGSIVMPDRVGSAKAAAEIAMTWAVENGWSNEALSKASLPGKEPPIPAFSLSSEHVMKPKVALAPNGTTMFIARFDSRSFEFVALGATHAEAVTAMVAGLDAHTQQHGLEAGWWGVADDLNVDECPVGGCLRDHALLSGPEQGVQGPKDVVNEGWYSGKVLSVANGVVTQKINRAGKTVRHDATKLSETVKVGDVVDIEYVGLQGKVSGLGKAAGVER